MPPNGKLAPRDCSRYYISVAGIGYDAEIVYKLSSWMKINFGVAGYVWKPSANC